MPRSKSRSHKRSRSKSRVLRRSKSRTSTRQQALMRHFRKLQKAGKRPTHLWYNDMSGKWNRMTRKDLDCFEEM